LGLLWTLFFDFRGWGGHRLRDNCAWPEGDSDHALTRWL